MQSQFDGIINQVMGTIIYAYNWGIKVLVIVTAALIVTSIIAYVITASK